ncbi:uncharacterized protein LOC135078487 [Ostrinia nubilalis]|uniref:uncharacterized protein LOC135078487 n=1 Tax=Ostrinia nubilalis TaxID=29057 RepID=UPI0030823CB2
MAAVHIVFALELLYFSKLFVSGVINGNVSTIPCPYFRNSPRLNVQDLVGSWLTVYTQPKAIDCFTLHIRATTELEREQYVIKYGNFSERVNWENCLLEVESPLGKHFLQGNGTEAGLLENIIVTRGDEGNYIIQEQSADQWTVYGRRGSEVLVMRDCMGEAAAAFARAPYWPSAEELYAILHRSGIAPLAQGRVLCEPRDLPPNQLSISRYFSNRIY